MARKPQPSAGFLAYDEDEWQAIRAAYRAGWPPGADLEQVRYDLELAGRMYSLWCERWARASAVPRRELLRACRQAEELRHLVYVLMRQIPRSDSFRPQRAFDGLQEIHRTLRPRLVQYEVWASKLFKGRRDAYREYLLWRACQIWLEATGDWELRISRSAHAPTGPLIAFLQAALGPIWGRAPSAETLVTAIKRERAARKRAS